MKWYTIQTRAQYENKVISEIKIKLENAGLSDRVEEIFAPEETVITYDNGVKKESKKKLYSNYIFIKLKYDETVWHVLKDIRGCNGFIGDKASPRVVPDSEIDSIKQKLATGTPRPKTEYAVDQRVFIKSGSFKDFHGTVKSVDYEKSRIKISVIIFGRETLIEMELVDVELSN